MQYIHKYLELFCGERERSWIKILDIGAGTGRYSIPLAEEGYEVTAVELVKHNLGRLKQKCDKVRAIQGNALRLKKLEDNTFDLTLLFGPMYHLHGADEKLQALQEAKRVTRPGGIILVA
ncbi:MAG: class I SAM-dependent methyltransferase, partial [Agathobacter sp.]|nr:class I SAM-dependent methyltransferase [Agathobacter sp.]